MENPQWPSQPVLNAVDTHLQRQNGYAQSCEATVEILGDVASLFAGDEERVDKLRQAAAAVLAARRGAQLQCAALQELKGTYVATGESTPFETQLKQRAAQLGEQQPYSVSEDPLYRDFQAAVGVEAEGGGAGDDEQIDDDIAIEGGQNQLAPNATCPITTKPLLQLEEPVEDSHGVVYERQAVEGYLKALPPSKRGRAVIMAGSRHEVGLEELVPALRVLREIKRRQRRRQLGCGAQQGGGDADVLDV